MILIHHIGAKSGIQRVTPLGCFPQGDGRFAIVASNGGSPTHPDWYHNLKANPETTIQVGSRRIPVRARVATPAERKRLWPKAVAAWNGYEGYQKRTEREIPLVVLEPRPD
jgi:deazaflavin-dependent oxidoreductase (nitroreductase family)